MAAASRLGSLLVAASLLLGSPLHAQDGATGDAALEEARAHASKAKVHYDLGEYEQSAEEYILVYRIKPLPALLFNIAQAFRQAGKYEKAKQFYKSFLRESPDQKSKQAIEKAIKEIDEVLAKEKRAKDLGPSGTAEASQLNSHSTDASKASLAAAPAQLQSQAAVAPAAPPVPVQRPAAPASSIAASDRPVTVAVATQHPPRAAPAEITRRAAVPATSTSVEESTPLYKKWWVWTAVGVVAVGAGAVALGAGGNTAPASHFGTSKVFP